MRVRNHLLAVTLAGLVLPASATSAAPAFAVSASECPAQDAVMGTVRDLEGTVSDEDAQVSLFAWDDAVGAFAPESTWKSPSSGGLSYCFPDLDAGFYTVRVQDTSGRYVPDTWADGSGQMPTSTSGPGVAEASSASMQELDVWLLKQLSNEGAAPEVTGLRRSGYRLSATPGGWNPDASTLTFAWQWQRVDSQGNVRNIPGATRPTYVLTAAEVGQGIRVRATGRRAGYAPESGYSDETEVGRSYSKTAVRLAQRRIHATSRGRIRVTVTPSTARPTGTVTVKVDGRRRLATTLKTTQAGSVALLLPRLGRGTHRVVAVYGGSRGLYGSTSRPTILTVVR